MSVKYTKQFPAMKTLVNVHGWVAASVGRNKAKDSLLSMVRQHAPHRQVGGTTPYAWLHKANGDEPINKGVPVWVERICAEVVDALEAEEKKQPDLFDTIDVAPIIRTLAGVDEYLNDPWEEEAMAREGGTEPTPEVVNDMADIDKLPIFEQEGDVGEPAMTPGYVTMTGNFSTAAEVMRFLAAGEHIKLQQVAIRITVSGVTV